MSVIDEFSKNAEVYDQQRKKIIPFFEDFYGCAFQLLDLEKKNPKVLDLGAGTGLYSLYLLDKYPGAKLTLIDLSQEMLDIAKIRFKDYNDFNYIVDNYLTYEFDEKFDIIISSLSVHHLKEEDKRRLYEKYSNLLNDEGVFIMADLMLSPSNNLENIYLDFMSKYESESGLYQEEQDKLRKRRSYDIPSPMNLQLKWLNEFGFKDVDVIYKYYNFAVLYGKK